MPDMPRPGSVIAWVDNSPHAMLALDAAARDAQATRAPLHIVISAAPSSAGGQRLADRAINRINLRDRMIQASVEVADDAASQRLAAVCALARHLVIPDDATGRDTFEPQLLHLPCPVVWIGANGRPASITHGVDQDAPNGSPAPIASSKNAISNAASRQAS